MTFNIRRLDNLDYDDVEPILEDYIFDAIEEFVNSEIGQAYAKTDPKVGSWIGTFVEMAYLYGGVTLPQMTERDVRGVMETVLPRKLALPDPREAETAVPQLIAFWQFLRETYRLRSANKILRYLESIGDRFPAWMSDPSRGGFMKQFFMQGIEAGYDMTSPEEVAAFQEAYNQRRRESPESVDAPASSERVPMVAPPPEVQQLFDQLGIELPPEGSLVDPREVLGKAAGMLEQLAGVLPVTEGSETEPQTIAIGGFEDLFPPPPDDSLRSLQAEVMMSQLGESQPLSEAEQAILREQRITATEPGSIVHDFQAALEFVGPEGIEVSGKLCHFPLKRLGELNERLQQPIELAMKRPQQKSYPPIHGLYLLLRATGLVRIVAKGKKNFMVLNPSLHEAWQQLNPTEQYFTLLEAWLVRGTEEMLGEARPSWRSSGFQCLASWHELERLALHDRQTLTGRPGLHNLALLELFGFLLVKTAKPKAGEGWAIRAVKRTPFGNAALAALRNIFVETGLEWESETDVSVPFQELKPAFEPYFPEWQQAFALPQPEFRAGRYVFKVSLGKIWRRIAIDSEATLADLSALILFSVDFDSDHLDQFTYSDPIGRRVEVVHPYASGEHHTTEVTIGSLPLSAGDRLEYLFDFGDYWQFDLQLEAIEEQPEGSAKGDRQTDQLPGEILASHGRAPQQYPDYD